VGPDRDFRRDARFMDQDPKSPLGGIKTAARAFFVADRLNTSGLERGDVLATTPLAFRVNDDGVAVLFRYGVVVLIGLNALEEEEFLRGLQSRMTRPFARRDEEIAAIELAADKDDQIPPGGPICLQRQSPERLILIAEVLAKSVVLARHEREVATVFDTTEPFARELAQSGRMSGGRRAILKHIGNALSVRHRVTGPVEVSDKPDILWDKPHLERLYARLEDEYELRERAESLNGKLAVIAESAQVLTDIIDTRRSLRLELIIVFLILFEVIMTVYQLAFSTGRHG
jgi:required for meiotic nuclear division protein 1